MEGRTERRLGATDADDNWLKANWATTDDPDGALEM